MFSLTEIQSLVKHKRKGKRKMRYLVTFCGRRSEIIKAHDDEEAIQIAQATSKSEDAKTRFVANHPPYRVRRIVK